jgi:uncharacterized protein DUF3325
MLKTAPALSSLLALYAGWSMLAVSQARHWARVTGSATKPPTESSTLGFRLAAAGLLLIGLLLCVHAAGASFGVVLWFAQLFLSASMVIVTLSWKPFLLKPSARLLASIETVARTSKRAG